MLHTVDMQLCQRERSLDYLSGKCQAHYICCPRGNPRIGQIQHPTILTKYYRFILQNFQPLLEIFLPSLR